MFLILFLTEALQKVIIVGLKLTNQEWTQKFDDSTNSETITFVGQIENAVGSIVSPRKQGKHSVNKIAIKKSLVFVLACLCLNLIFPLRAFPQVNAINTVPKNCFLNKATQHFP